MPKKYSVREINKFPNRYKALSVLFGCKNFHEFVCGHHFKVENDYKPLSYLPTPPLGQGMTQGQFLSGV